MVLRWRSLIPIAPMVRDTRQEKDIFPSKKTPKKAHHIIHSVSATNHILTPCAREITFIWATSKCKSLPIIKWRHSMTMIVERSPHHSREEACLDFHLMSIWDGQNDDHERQTRKWSVLVHDEDYHVLKKTDHLYFEF